MNDRPPTDVSPLEALCVLVERGLPGDASWSVERPWRDGWCLLRGPTCCFFVGEARDADGRRWISFGPVARRTKIEGQDGRFDEAFSYHFRATDRRALGETPLGSEIAAADARGFLEDLHGRVVEDLGEDALLWDGWVVWGWGSQKPWPTVPGLAGPG